MEPWGQETSGITLHAQDPASLPLEGAGVGWLPTTHSRTHGSLVPQDHGEGAGLPGSTADFSHTS